MDGSGYWCILISLFFVGLTAFASLAYYSLRQISWVKLEEKLEQRGRETLVQIIHQKFNSLVYSSSMLRLLSNLGLLMSVAYYFMASSAEHTRLPHWLPLAEAFLLSAIILLIFSVGIPQAWAKYAGTAVLVHCYRLIALTDFLLRPLTILMHAIDALVGRLAGVTFNGSLEERIEERQEELLSMVEGQKKEGMVDEQEREMIESVLDFRDTTVDQIMTPRTEIIGINVEEDFKRAAETIVKYGHSRYPVYEESIDKIIGMLYAKDLLKDIDNPKRPAGIRSRLREAFFVPETKTVRDLLHDFQTQKVHLAVVLDEYGGTGGIVTIEDVVEELVGEIEDEYEEAPRHKPLLKLSPTEYEVDARFHVDELNDELELEIPEDDDYETIGGFVFARLGSIPKSGDSFDYENLRFTVLDAEPRKINRLRLEIRLLPDETPESSA